MAAGSMRDETMRTGCAEQIATASQASLPYADFYAVRAIDHRYFGRRTRTSLVMRLLYCAAVVNLWGQGAARKGLAHADGHMLARFQADLFSKSFYSRQVYKNSYCV